MDKELEFKIVDFSNVEEAIKIQKEIFPHEDGTINLLASIDRDLFMKIAGLFYLDDKVKYYLAYLNDQIIGITGLYSYVEKYPTDAWIAWYGVLPKHRGFGLGSKILNWTINKAKNEKYENIRLYTSIIENKKAIELYKRFSFIEEKYTAEDLWFDCYIFSKNLNNKKTELWDNKKLDLGYQTELDHLDDSKICEILKKYNLYIKKV